MAISVPTVYCLQFGSSILNFFLTPLSSVSSRRQIIMTTQWALIALLASIPTAKLEEKVRSIELSSVTHIAANSLDQETYFLYEMKRLTEYGKYLNQSEKDFHPLNPSCTCLPSPLPSNCKDDCCYCKIQCPLPENPFTGELLSYKTAWCKNKTLLQNKVETSGKKKLKPIVPWRCERAEDGHDYTSRLAKVFCIYGVHFGETKIYYNINPGWTTNNRVGGGGLQPTSYTWGSQRKDQELKKKQFNPPQDIIMAHQLFMGNGTTMRDNDGIVKSNATLGNITFTKEKDPSTDGGVKFTVNKPLQFSFTALSKCSELSRGGSLAECIYLISGTAWNNCTQLREAILITTHIASYALENVKTVTPLGRLSVQNERDVLDGSVACELIPAHGVLTEVRYRTNTLGLYVNFDLFLAPPARSEFPLRLAYNRFYVSDEQYSNLPKFWNDIMYAVCPEQFCWRDLGKLGPAEAWRLSEPDDTLFRNIVYILLPIAPICAYFLISAIF